MSAVRELTTELAIVGTTKIVLVVMDGLGGVRMAGRGSELAEAATPNLDRLAREERDGLLERGLPVHLVNHLATMADLHRAGRYDRMSDDVRTLTGQGPLSVQEFVRKHAATFTASAKEA